MNRQREPQTVRLPGADQRYQVVDQFMTVHYTQPADGKKPKLYGYKVVIVAARKAAG